MVFIPKHTLYISSAMRSTSVSSAIKKSPYYTRLRERFKEVCIAPSAGFENLTWGYMASAPCSHRLMDETSNALGYTEENKNN